MVKSSQNGGKATAERGEVMLDGPNGVVVSMTPTAASETAAELDRAAGEGHSQLLDMGEETNVPPEKREHPPQA